MDQLPIAVVERETGLSKDTLRVWERRYGFPKPERDDFGDRVYRAVDVQQLRLLRRLLDMGHRPAKIVGLSLERLNELTKAADAPAQQPHVERVDAVLHFLQQSDLSSLRDHLAQQLATHGVMAFVCDYLAPLTAVVGDAWARGDIGVAQEHVFTEIVTRLLRSNLQQLSSHQREGRKILFATLPGEQHGLGLLMAECIVAVKGNVAIPLGTEVPLEQLLWACEAYRCDVVALSFSQARSSTFVADGVRAIRTVLPESVQVWVGGSGAGLLKTVPEGVAVFRQLAELRDLA
ncbi:MAG: MerR family transcriptional regulator [Rhizobium sp.]|nr:MAG: MerR family transcriptional regulator [Rhizobium sp.]